MTTPYNMLSVLILALLAACSSTNQEPQQSALDDAPTLDSKDDSIFDTIHRLNKNDTIHGTLEKVGFDLYRVDLEIDDRIELTIEGNPGLKPSVYLYEAFLDEEPLKPRAYTYTNNESTLNIEWQIDIEQTYFLLVKSYKGQSAGRYTMTIETSVMGDEELCLELGYGCEENCYSDADPRSCMTVCIDEVTEDDSVCKQTLYEELDNKALKSCQDVQDTCMGICSELEDNFETFDCRDECITEMLNGVPSEDACDEVYDTLNEDIDAECELVREGCEESCYASSSDNMCYGECLDTYVGVCGTSWDYSR